MNITTVCNYTCDVTSLSDFTNPLFFVAGAIGWLLIMFGLLKWIQWMSYPCHDP
jgi:hypothetical protein